MEELIMKKAFRGKFFACVFCVIYSATMMGVALFGH